MDALGSRCPVPVRLLARAMSRRAPGEVLELLADDPLILVDLPAWCHSTGHQLMEIHERGSGWCALVRHRSDDPIGCEGEADLDR
ncbi:MAG: sulfurtransferase TusA family protein [Thermoleophilia bacterium]